MRSKTSTFLPLIALFVCARQVVLKRLPAKFTLCQWPSLLPRRLAVSTLQALLSSSITCLWYCHCMHHHAAAFSEEVCMTPQMRLWEGHVLQLVSDIIPPLQCLLCSAAVKVPVRRRITLRACERG